MLVHSCYFRCYSLTQDIGRHDFVGFSHLQQAANELLVRTNVQLDFAIAPTIVLAEVNNSLLRVVNTFGCSEIEHVRTVNAHNNVFRLAIRGDAHTIDIVKEFLVVIGRGRDIFLAMTISRFSLDAVDGHVEAFVRGIGNVFFNIAKEEPSEIELLLTLRVKRQRKHLFILRILFDGKHLMVDDGFVQKREQLYVGKAVVETAANGLLSLFLSVSYLKQLFVVLKIVFYPRKRKKSG